LLEFFLLRNKVIGGQHRHNTSCRARAYYCRAECYRGTSVAADRFGDDVFFGELRQLLPNLRRLCLIGDDQDILHRHQGQNAINRLLEERTVAEQRDELFGCLLAAYGPKALASTAG